MSTAAGRSPGHPPHGQIGYLQLPALDVAASAAFYRSVFGWEPVTHEGPMPYTEFKVGDQSIAGMMQMPPMVPAEVPSHWLVYFGVDDTDAAVARTQELGGSVRMGPMDVPVGRFAVLADPQGGTFAVIRLAQQAT